MTRRVSISRARLRAKPLLTTVFGIALGAALLLPHGVAHANGRLPASNAFAFHPTTPSTIYMRTTFGALVAKDSGHAWDWICERTLGLTTPEDPAFGVFADGTVAVTTFEGLSVTHDGACSFAFVGGDLSNANFIDIAVRKDTYTAAVVITSNFANTTDDAGNAYFRSKVFATTDSGKTWAKRGADLDPTILVETVDWSQADPTRVYVSGARGTGTSPQGVILVSDDGGSTFMEHTVPLLGPKERAPFIAALDPMNKDIVYVRTNGSQVDPARLLISTDGGKTWNAAFTSKGPLQGFALNDDGTKVFVGGPSDGLYSASTKDLAFAKVSSLQVQCLGYQKGQLWACSNEFSGFTAGLSTDDGKTFEPRLHLTGVRGPLACPAGTTTHELCTADWPTQEAALGISAGGEGGASDAGSAGDDAGPSTKVNAGGGGACSVVLLAAPAGVAGALMGLALLALLARRAPRNQARRKPPTAAN